MSIIKQRLFNQVSELKLFFKLRSQIFVIFIY